MYKISGRARKLLKSALSKKKHHLKYFWFEHQANKDMYEFLNCDKSTLHSDEDMQTIYDELSKEIEYIEKRLNETIT